MAMPAPLAAPTTPLWNSAGRKSEDSPSHIRSIAHVLFEMSSGMQGGTKSSKAMQQPPPSNSSSPFEQTTRPVQDCRTRS